MPASMLLQDWITVKGQSGSVTVTMPAGSWPDLSGVLDVMLHTEISAYSGSGGQIAFQTAPARDDGLFEDMDTVAFTQSSPAITIVRFSSATVPVSRFVRWKISAAAAWEVTFRVWMTVRTV